MTQRLTIEARQGGIEFGLSSGSEQLSMLVPQEQADSLARRILQIVFHTEDSVPKTLLHPPLALASQVPLCIWGAVDDGTIALSLHLNELRPMLFKFSDQQAADLRDGLSELLAMPRNVRVPLRPS